MHIIPQINNLVQIAHNSEPRLQWCTGIISSLNYGRDNQIRSVNIRLPKGTIIRRPINMIFCLESQ